MSALFDLSGRTALVTGSGRGIGRAICLTLSEAGATVMATDVDGDAAAETASMLSEGRGLTAQVLDVTSRGSIAEAMRRAVDDTGRLDILVNNAGINFGNDTPAEDLPLEVWQRQLDVNLTGPFLCAQQAATHMIPQGGGKIINIASTAAVVIPRLDDRYTTAYSASKAGLVMLTRSLGLQWAKHGITVNAISPTFTDAGLIQRDETRIRQMEASTPFARLGRTSDLDGAVVYLASSASDFTTGHNLLVDGGCSL